MNETKNIFIVRNLHLLCLAVILLFSFRQKIILLQEYSSKTLDPDAVHYRYIADHMQSPIDTEAREPLFIWLAKGMFLVFGSSDLNLRILTLILSMVCVILLFFLALRLFNPFVAIFATFLYGTNYWFSYSGVRGLRHELYTLIFLLLAWVLIPRVREKSPNGNEVPNGPLSAESAGKSPVTWLWVGILGGLAFLSNLGFFSVMFALIVFFGIKKKWRIPHIFLSLFLALLMVSPYLVHCRVKYGEIFYANNMIARGMRNREFAGKPGFPTKMEVKENLYRGSQIKMSQFIFKLHSPKEILRRSAYGLHRIYSGEFPKYIYFYRSALLKLFYLIGLLELVRRVFCRRSHPLLASQSLDILVFYFLIGAPFSFFAGGDFDWRHVIHLAPLASCFSMIGILKSVEFFTKQNN